MKEIVQTKKGKKFSRVQRRMCQSQKEGIFAVSKKTRPSLNSQCDFSTTQTEITEESFSPQNQSNCLDFVIPSFFNDIKRDDFHKKLSQYNELYNKFDDIEERELYIIRKDSLFSMNY